MIRLRRLELSDNAPAQVKGKRGPKPKSLKDDLKERQESLNVALDEWRKRYARVQKEGNEAEQEKKLKEERRSIIEKHWKHFRDADRPREESAAKILKAMCNKKCAYCEYGEANEIDHYWPKSLHPEKTFDWTNMLPSCGSCNTQEHKGHKLELIDESGQQRSKWLDPSAPSDDPFRLLVFTIDTMIVSRTNSDEFNPVGWVDPREALSDTQMSRVDYTISELKLNTRSAIRHQRAIIIGSFLRLLQDLAERGPNAIRGGRTVCEQLAEILSSKTPCLGSIRQVLREKPEIREAVVACLNEKQQQELAAWDLEPPPPANGSSVHT